MKKLLSVALCLTLILTTFSGMFALSVSADATPTTGGIVVVKDFSNYENFRYDTFYQFDDTTFGEPCAKVDFNGTDETGVFPGCSNDLRIDASKLNYNTKYQVRLTMCLTGEETDKVRVVFKAAGKIDGQDVTSKAGFDLKDDYDILGSMWSSADLSPTNGFEEFTCNTAIMPFGTDFRIRLFTTGVNENSENFGIYLKKIELVPLKSTVIRGGTVKMTGVQEGTNKVIYTAIPDEGYEVSSTAATSMETYGAAINYGIDVIDNVNGAVSFTVDHGDKNLSNCGVFTATDFGGVQQRYLTVNFSRKTGPNDPILLREFTDAGSVNGTWYQFDDTTFGEPCAKVSMDRTDLYGRLGDSNDIRPNLNQVDYNRMYKVRISMALTGETTDKFNIFFKTLGSIYNGREESSKNAIWGPDDYYFLTTSETPAVGEGFKDYTCDIPIVPYGSDFRIRLFTNREASNSASAGIYIRSIEFIPVKESIIAGGSVKMTGVENGQVVYTATPDAGYKVGSINAETAGIDCGLKLCGINILDEINGVVRFTVDHKNDDDGTFVYSYLLGNDFRYLTVNFDKADNNTVIVEDFNGLKRSVLDNGRSIDTTKAYSGDKSLKVDLTKSAKPSFGLPGFEVTLYPDMNKLDVNKKYRLRFAACTDSSSTFSAQAKFMGVESGNVHNAAWTVQGHDDFQVLGDPVGAEWKEYICNEIIQPFGSDFRINFYMWTGGGATGNLWIDKVELVPVENGIDDGVVRVTGFDTETNSPIYTATANDGFKVDEIRATVYNAAARKNLTINEKSRTADNKTVEFEVSGIVDGDKMVAHGNSLWNHNDAVSPGFDVSYITVLFGADKPILMDKDDKYIVSDFEDNANDFYGNDTPIDDGGLNTGRCYSTDAESATLSFCLDANTVHKFDAANSYKLSALIQSDDDWVGAIQVKVYSHLGGKQVSVLSDLYAGEFALLGNYAEASETKKPDFVKTDGSYYGENPMAEFGWTKYSIPERQMFPVTGDSVTITIEILRTSETGTVYLDDITLFANDCDDKDNWCVFPIDYSKQNGYVKAAYDYVNDQMIYTPVAFEGYKFNTLDVNYRVWGGITINDVKYENSLVPMEKTAVTYADEPSFAVDATHLNDFGDVLRFQTHWNMGNYCKVSFVIPGIKGDVNGDEVVNLIDLVKLKKYVADNTVTINEVNSKITDDDVIDIDDIVALRKILLGVAV